MLKAVAQEVQLLTASSRCHSAGASGAAAFVRREGESAASGDAADAMALLGREGAGRERDCGAGHKPRPRRSLAAPFNPRPRGTPCSSKSFASAEVSPDFSLEID